MRLITFFVLAVCAFAPIRYVVVDHGICRRTDVMPGYQRDDSIRYHRINDFTLWFMRTAEQRKQPKLWPISPRGLSLWREGT